MKFGQGELKFFKNGYHLVAVILLVVSMPLSAQIDGPYSRQVQQMYVAYYGRFGDHAGVGY